MQPVAPWIDKHATAIPNDKPVLDLACGKGRHSLFLLNKGYDVTAVDIDIEAISAHQGREGLTILQADLEAKRWPFAENSFSGIVVVNYLWRPLFAEIEAALMPGGVLLYDTFRQGNEKFGRPSNPDFLLAPGELMQVFGSSLEVIDYFDGTIEKPSPACRQSIAARKPS
jgi:SAM-dependent methyltransferase